MRMFSQSVVTEKNHETNTFLNRLARNYQWGQAREIVKHQLGFDFNP